VPSDEADKRYLYYLIKTVAPKLADFDAHGSTMRHIKKESLSASVFVPCVKDQSLIAKVLDKEVSRINALINEKQNFINLLKEKRQALISHVVTKGLDPDVEFKDSGFSWIGQVPKHWELSKLKYEGTLIPGYSFSSTDFCDNGTRVIKISNIQHDYIDWSDESFLPDTYSQEYKKFLVSEGDIVFALTRPIISTGIKASLFPKVEFKALLNQRNAFLRPDLKNNNLFLYYLLFANYFLSQFENSIDATGQQPNISTTDISTLRIVMPPKSEQDEICRYLKSQIDAYHALEKEVNLSIELLKEHRTALISAAVTGKIDLRDKEVA
jgi:type I restriction enzyme S subunit